MRLFDEGRPQELFGELSCLARLDRVGGSLLLLDVKLVTKLKAGPSVSNTVDAWLGLGVSLSVCEDCKTSCASGSSADRHRYQQFVPEENHAHLANPRRSVELLQLCDANSRPE